MDPPAGPKFDHVVVLMFENRSFDNLFGYLYDPGEVPRFEGLASAAYSNPIPAGARDAERGTVPAHLASELDTPDPDPGEEHPHTNAQLFGRFDPPENQTLAVGEMRAPFNAPAAGTTPTMDGFVLDYIAAYREQTGRDPGYDDYAQIMASIPRSGIPVLATLAREFACFDHWFCEVPSQTYTNRSFFHAATASGFVLNSPPGTFPTSNDAETIFERLTAAHLPWKVYFDRAQLVSATGLIHARRLDRFFGTNFCAMEDFYDDAARGALPAYAFIEPCLIPPHSDMHPPGISRIRRYLPFLPRPAAIRGGEALLARVYEAVRGSTSPNGSNYSNTLLIVTFDEHGGTYDHVPPPPAPPPDPAAPPGQLGFKFDRSGVRIPTVAISAWVDRRTVVSQEYRSTSVIRTLRGRWPALGAPLTGRDAVAADIAPVLSRAEPRPPEDWPRVYGPPAGRLSQLLASLGRPLPKLSRHLFETALAYEAHATGAAAAPDLAGASRRTALRSVRGLRRAAFPNATRRRR